MIKKTTAIVALLLFVILFTAGTVTAGLALSSTTHVDENDVDDQHIVISSTTYTDILDAVKYDTTNDGGTISYALHYDYDTDGTPATFEAVKISKDFNIRVDKTNVTEATFDLTVTVSKFTAIAGLTYTLKVGDSTAAFTGGSATFTGLAYNTDLAVVLYVSGTLTNPTVATGLATAGFTNYVENTEDGSVFTFTAVNHIA